MVVCDDLVRACRVSVRDDLLGLSAAVCLPVLYDVHFAPFPGFYVFGGLLSVSAIKSRFRGILGVVCACYF